MNNPLHFLAGADFDHVGRTIHDYMRFDPQQLESIHDYIQRAFPTDEVSRFHPDAPVLLKEHFEDEALVKAAMPNVFWMANHMIKFYENIHHWMTIGDHNHLRITRILKCLCRFGMPLVAESFLDLILARIDTQTFNTATLQFWSDALKTESWNRFV